MINLDKQILKQISNEYLTVSQLTKILTETYKQRIDVRIKQLRKWNFVEYKRVDTGTTGKKPLAYTISTSGLKYLKTNGN